MIRILHPFLGVEQDGPDMVRVYHTKLRLLDSHMVQSIMTGVDPDLLNFEISPLIMLVLGVPGVCAAELRAYQLRVQRADMWEWGEIEPKILEIMFGALPALYETIEIERLRDEGKINDAQQICAFFK